MPTNAMYALTHRAGQVWDAVAKGGIAAGLHTAFPTAGVGNRGVLMRTEGGEAAADTMAVTLKTAADTYVNYYPVLSTAGNFVQEGQLRQVVDTGGAFATPIVLTAADSGTTYLLDDAAGLDFTLPVISAANIGMIFRFVLITEVTSNSYRFTAGEATDLYHGHIVMYDKDVAEGSTEALLQIFRPDLSNDVVLTIAGADDTTGALIGGWLEFEAVMATRWFIRGSLIGDGALATVFS